MYRVYACKIVLVSSEICMKCESRISRQIKLVFVSFNCISVQIIIIVYASYLVALWFCSQIFGWIWIITMVKWFSSFRCSMGRRTSINKPPENCFLNYESRLITRMFIVAIKCCVCILVWVWRCIQKRCIRIRFEMPIGFSSNANIFGLCLGEEHIDEMLWSNVNKSAFINRDEQRTTETNSHF